MTSNLYGVCSEGVCPRLRPMSGASLQHRHEHAHLPFFAQSHDSLGELELLRHLREERQLSQKGATIVARKNTASNTLQEKNATKVLLAVFFAVSEVCHKMNNIGFKNK